MESAFARRAEAMALVREYRALKAAYGLMDFSDQIALAARLAAEHPVVGELERDKYAVVLLDEYQDTSVAQAQMLSSLFGGGHPVTAVGDPNQAIYGWRGASVSNILHFGQDFPAAGGQVARYALTVNRRSDRRILEVANALAAPLYDAFAQVDPLEPGTDDDGSVDTIVHLTSAAELAWLAEQVPATHGAMETPSWREIGVLVRDNAHAADVFDALTAAGVPVEIVGLAGLLRLPEVAEVLATLTLVDDLTANAELLTLLTGPRWAIGPRDLALLGTRAGELAESGRGRGTSLSLDEELARAVAGADPTELVALSDALDDPGDLPYSPAARQRFSLLASELRYLRSHAGEPLLELVRRIIDACGLDVELASSVSEAGRARRENLDLFVKAVADFQAVDGTVSLTSLLAWLQAEDDLGEGLDVATPSEADSVKLLTVHRAKGLEWDAVFLVGMCAERFPHTRSRGLWPERARPAAHAPARRPPRPAGAARPHQGRAGPAQGGHQGARGHRGAAAGLRRLHPGPAPAGRVVVRLGRGPRRRPGALAVPGDRARRDGGLGRRAAGLGGQAGEGRRQPPVRPAGGVPLAGGRADRRGAAPGRGRRARGRGPRPAGGRAGRRRGRSGLDAGLDLVEQARVREWDDELAHLVAEARRDRAQVVEVPLPAALSATTLQRLRRDPDGLAVDLVRPMPRPPAPAARFGTLFHEWVEQRFGQQALLEPEEVANRGDDDIDDYADLRELIATFEAGPFATRVPYAVEAPFALVLDGQVVRGRIDAVYAEPDGGYLLVDWKTNRTASADPLPAGGLPARVVGADRRPARPGPGRVLLRAHGCAGHPRRPARSRGARGPGQAGLSAAVSAISTIAPKVSWRSSAVVSSPVTMWSATVAMVSARRPYFAARV